MLTKIQQLIAIIQIGDTGTSKDISIKLGVSERMVFKYIEILKTEFKAPLKFNSLNKTYIFDGKGKLDLCWYIVYLNKDFLTLSYIGRSNTLENKRVK